MMWRFIITDMTKHHLQDFTLVLDKIHHMVFVPGGFQLLQLCRRLHNINGTCFLKKSALRCERQGSGGSRISHRGATLLREGETPDAAMFHKICMSKWNNWDLRGRMLGTPPWIRQCKGFHESCHPDFTAVGWQILQQSTALHLKCVIERPLPGMEILWLAHLFKTMSNFLFHCFSFIIHGIVPKVHMRKDTEEIFLSFPAQEEPWRQKIYSLTSTRKETSTQRFWSCIIFCNQISLAEINISKA